MILSMLAAVVLMADTPAAAQAAEPSAPPVSAQKKLTREGMVCRKEAVLGSKMPKRVCMTASQLEERKAQDRELTERMQSSTRVGTSN